MDHLSLTKKIVSLGVLLLIVAASATQTEVAKVRIESLLMESTMTWVAGKLKYTSTLPA